jgi:hypothetical protein
MHAMRPLLFSIVLALLVNSHGFGFQGTGSTQPCPTTFNGSGGGQPGCVPGSGCLRVTFERPPTGPGSGMPITATWVGGTGDPHGFDADAGGWLNGGPPDDLGNGSVAPGGSTVSITFENTGLGGLVSCQPNATDPHDHAFEGDCLEVFVRWSFDYNASCTTSVTRGGGNSFPTVNGLTVTETSSSSTSITTVYYLRGHRDSPVVELCPC